MTGHQWLCCKGLFSFGFVVVCLRCRVGVPMLSVVSVPVWGGLGPFGFGSWAISLPVYHSCTVGLFLTLNDSNHFPKKKKKLWL